MESEKLTQNEIDKFFDFLQIENNYSKKQKVVIELSARCIAENETEFFFQVFPRLILMMKEDEKKREEWKIVPLKGYKIIFHHYAVINNNDQILSTLIRNNFVPEDHQLRYQVIHCDRGIFDLFSVGLPDLSDSSSLRMTDDFFDRQVDLTNTIDVIVETLIKLLHQHDNRQFLKEFLSIPIVKINFDFHQQILKDCIFSERPIIMDRIKFFIEASGQGTCDNKRKNINLAQLFIDTVFKSASMWPTENINNLIFLIKFGGTRIDPVVSFFRGDARERSFEIFFQLVARKIKFETQDKKLLANVEQFLSSIKMQLEKVGIFKELADIILLNF